MNASQWATLRQVVLATDDIAGAAAVLRERLQLGAGFADPVLAGIGVVDDTMALAGGSYLELVAPLDAESSLARWLAKVGGQSGYALSIQYPDPLAARDRAAARGVRVVTDRIVLGHPVVQLHPADAGLLLELDGITDPDAWFWDGMGVLPAPDALVDDVVGVDVGVADPEASTALWSHLLALPPADSTSINLGGRTVRFHPLASAPAWTITLRRSARGEALRDESLVGVGFRYV